MRVKVLVDEDQTLLAGCAAINSPPMHSDCAPSSDILKYSDAVFRR